MANSLYRLTVRRGPEEGQSFTLSDDSITVGRDPMADIVLKDPEISRQHARFIRSGDGYQVQDLGSTNGTFVEGRRLSGEAETLSPGTVITMGSNVTLVYDATQDPAATVISPESEFNFEDEAVENVESGFAEGTPLAGEAESARVYDMPEPEPMQAEEPALPDDDATAFDFSTEDDMAEVAGTEADELPSFDTGYEEMDDQKTVLDMEAEPVSAYSYEGEEGDLPSFDADDDYDLPSFDAEPEPAYKAEEAYTPEAQSVDRTPPPPPPPAPPEAQGRNRNVIIAAVILLLLLCCCCLALWAGWTYGDAFITMMGLQLQ